MNEEILNLINESILPENDKQTLRDLLRNENESDNFYQKFNEFIIAEVHRRGDKFIEIYQEYEKAQAALDEEMDNRRLNEETLLDQALEKIDEDDLERRTTLFDAYYAALDKIDVEHEERMRNLITDVSKKLI